MSGAPAAGAKAGYTVVGMTCEHCVRAVTTELQRLPGVTGVEIDLASGVVNVISAARLPVQAVREAVTEAGYELADS